MHVFCQNLDGTPNNLNVAHLIARALCSASLICICTAMTQIFPNGCILLVDARIWGDKHIEPWKRVVDFIYQNTEAGMALNSKMLEKKIAAL